MTYKIVRFFFSQDRCRETVTRGLTLEQAQAHCNDPETSSSTCKLPENIRRTQELGMWFDGYEEEGA